MNYFIFYALIAVVSGKILSLQDNKEQDVGQNVINVKIGQILPRHQCRRAIRNLQVCFFSIMYD